MTTTATDLYVSCQKFCGAKITQTGENGRAQHVDGCGASDKDLNALDDALLLLRESGRDAAALDKALTPDAPAATFRCVCGETFPAWPELGQHQTLTGHQGMWQEPGDAVADDALNEREDTVDGARATINHDTRPKLLDVPVTDDSVLGNLARAMEEEAVLRTAANTAKNALAHAVKKTKAAAEYAAQHYAKSRQLVMNLTPGGTEPDDDGDDE